MKKSTRLLLGVGVAVVVIDGKTGDIDESSAPVCLPDSRREAKEG